MEQTTQSSGATTTGPASFSELPGTAWSEDSSSSTPASDSTPAASASAETTPPPAEPSTPDGQAPGEPPKERWDAILANARTKAAQEAIAPYAWAKDVNPQEFQQIRQIAAHFVNGDTLGGLKALMAEARKDPQVDAALRSEAARMLASYRQPAAEQEPQLEMIPIQLEDGRVVKFPTAESVTAREAWIQRKATEAATAQMQPHMQTLQTLQEARDAETRHATSVKHAESIFAEVSALPGVNDDSLAQMAQAIATDPLLPAHQPRTPEMVHLAAMRAYHKVVLPTLTQQAETKLLDSLKTKAAASVSVNPSAAAASASRSVHRFSDLPPEAWR